MHDNFYFLRQISSLLTGRLVGKCLIECFSQNAGELVFVFQGRGEDLFFMQVACRPDLAAVWFPNDFARARKNTANMFGQLIDKKIISLFQYESERAFKLIFENELSLIFKMFGSQSNVLVCDEQAGIIIDMLHSRRDKDLIILPNNPYKKWQNDGLSNVYLSELPKKYPQLSKQILQELVSQYPNWTHLDEPARIQILQKTENTLLNPTHYYLYQHDNLPVLSFFKYENTEPAYIFSSNQALAAITQWVRLWHKQSHFGLLKNKMVKELSKNLYLSKKYVENIENQIESAQKRASYQLQADLLMAYNHQILPAQTKAILPDFQTELSISINLDPHISPIANAEKYYRKAKQEHKFSDLLYQNLDKKQKQIAIIQDLLNQINQIVELPALQILSQNPYFAEKKAAEILTEAKPYYAFKIDGFQVLVGKNAAGNDELLRHFSRKDDLWLHARGYAGSHVIVRRNGILPVPQPVIEKAASLAAFYSKGKTNDFCPVICTARKYVRKPKGATPGMVRVEREEQIILAIPGKPTG